MKVRRELLITTKTRLDRRLLLLATSMAVLPFVVACSGEEGVGNSVGFGSVETDPTSCKVGDTATCSITLSQKSGILSCYTGVKECVAEDTWGPCEDGKVTEQIDPTYYTKDGQKLEDLSEKQRETLAYNTPAACVNNPCNPDCQYYAEDPPDISTMGGGMPPGPLDDWPTSTTTCAHQLCDADTAPLDRACHPCVQTVCDTPGFEYCCDGVAADSWDQACVIEVHSQCSASPPPTFPGICEFGILADDGVDLINATSYDNNIGAGQSWTVGSAVTARNLILGDPSASLTNNANYGAVHTTGDLNVDSSVTVEQITAFGNLNLVNNSAVGAGGVRVGGNLTGGTAWTIGGDAVIDGDCDITHNSTVNGEVHCGGAADLQTDGIAGTVYAGGDVNIGPQDKLNVDIHGGGNLTFGGNQAGTTESWFIGGDVTMWIDNLRADNEFHVGGNVDCTNSTGTGSLGPAFIGGSITGTCGAFNGMGGNAGAVTGAASPPLIMPTPPTLGMLPPPPIALPSVDDLARDTSAVCAIAAGRPNIGSSVTLYPGIYGNVSHWSGLTTTLNGPGAYVFNDISTSGTINLVGSGPWDITVCNNYAQNNPSKMRLNGGAQPDLEDVTIYSANSGGTCISSASSTWISGVLIAPDCDITMGNGSSPQVVTWGENVRVESGVSILNATSSCANANLWGGIVCGTTPLYQDGSSYSVGDEVTFGGLRYECTDAANCTTGGWTNYWPGRGTNWMSAWDEFDDCPVPMLPGAIDPSAMCPVTINPVTVLDTDVADCESALDCQVNQRCTEVVTPSPVCSHSKCSTGPALSNASCRANDACVDAICDLPGMGYCCSTSWDAACVAEVEATCGVECGAATPSVCPHNACTVGVALDRSCSATVQAVCDNDDSDCCDGGGPNAWDADCIDYLTTRLTGSPVQPGAVEGDGQSLCDFAAANGSGHIAMNLATVTGNVYADGQISGGGLLDGNGFTGLDVVHSNVSGSEYEFLSTPPFAAMDWDDVDPLDGIPGNGCEATTNTNQDWWWFSSPGSYGNVRIKQDQPLPPGDYYFNSLILENNVDWNLQAGDINIYICGNGFGVELWTGASINAVGNDPLQFNLWKKGNGNITFMNGSSADGVFSTVDGNGTIVLQGTAQINGMVHHVDGGVSFENNTSVDSSLVDYDDCLARGVDPLTPIANVCPTGDSPAQAGGVTESGVCVSNDDGSGNIELRPSCADVDLTMDAPCDDQVPVCNRGATPLSAGEAEIVFFPRQTLQFATTSPDTFWADASTCDVNVAVPSGSCVDVTCPTFTEDMTAFIQMKSAATQTECVEMDNWTYYPHDRMCASGGGGSVTETQVYEATCPANSAPAWGFLGWNSTLDGTSDMDISVRTSPDGTTWSGTTHLTTADAASMTENCAFVNCAVDVGTTLYPGGSINQDPFLELTFDINASGGDTATLEDWDLSYTCIVDQ